MKRKIKLYIAGQLADITDQTLVLFNYTQEDAANPTAVVAPYSQQITLPGTARNNTIFGDIWRPDRTTSADGSWTGTGFDPLKKTPFEIYADTGEILEAGYIRLDEITRNRRRIAYKATLFGNLGSLFYALSYNADGTPMTLADLDYTDDGGVNELDFVIDKNTVEAAWAHLCDTWSDHLWDIINFAPTYQGFPDGDFDPKKAIATPASVNLSPTQTDGDGVTYSADPSGYCLVNLPESRDEWAVKDLRSYLQRPVINFGAVMLAIKKKAADLGYTLTLDSLESMGDYAVDVGDTPTSKLWLTLPKLSALAPTTDTPLTLTKAHYTATTNPVATWAISGSVSSGTKMTVSVNTKLLYTVASTSPAPQFYHETYYNGASSSIVFLRLVGYANNVEQASSKIYAYMGRVYGASRHLPASPKAAMDLFGDNPYKDEDFAPRMGLIPYPVIIDANTLKADCAIGISVEGYDLDEVRLEVVKAGRIFWYGTRLEPDGATTSTAGIRPPLWDLDGTTVYPSGVIAGAGTGSDSISAVLPNSIRSGAAISKAILLGSTKTPADYLLSFAKTFGLYFVVEPSTKEVTLCWRSDFFNGGTIDLTKRIDRRSISLKPLAVESKWFVLKDETKGKFADEYAKTYGATYGSKKVNTGYEFNDETKDILSSSVLKGAVTALERSGYFNTVLRPGSVFVPSVFLDNGCTYTLWNDGKSYDTEIQTPPATGTTITYYNNDPGYDYEFANKLQLHDASGKAVDGEDILVFFEGVNDYEYFKVSDDDATMYNITGGKACWNLDPGNPAGLTIPSFQRYTWRSGWYHVRSSLDYGEPREMATLRQIYSDGDTRALYARAWRSYLTDRYDGDTKVMTCKVDLAGLRVDAGLLRNFYWYEGALWVLNKIKNYSMTTHAPTDCEFVQVQDKDNYTNGQNFSI